jgi:hypothetical protein
MRPLLLTLLVSSHLSYADTATDTQTLSLTVPLVALIDVDTTNSPTFEFIAPANAGDGFDNGINISNEISPLAISSNMQYAKLKAHTDIDLSQYNIKLTAKATVPGKSTAKKPLSTTDTELSAVGMIATNTATITLDADTTTGGSMIPYGVYTANIIYTLTQN